MKRRTFLVGAGSFAASASTRDTVSIVRVPESGIQPQIAVGSDGALHLLYLRGEARQGDLYYTGSRDEGRTFSTPIRVNSQPGSAVAAGTIRGGQIALGRNGVVHVAWNGSSAASPKGVIDPEHGKPSAPMLYSRFDPKSGAFEPQRNLMTSTWELDGGGSLAADRRGNVFVAWHGRSAKSSKGEEGRQVFVTRSSDDGRSFAAEAVAWDRPTGACGCCGMRLFAESDGTLRLMYRSATEQIHRDIYLLTSRDGKAFEGEMLHSWEINACPMSSMSFSESKGGTLAAWETAGQVYFASVTGRKPVAASGESAKRKHPVTARNERGETLLAWVESAGWQKSGTLAYRLFDAAGTPSGEVVSVGECPVWSFPAAFARRDGTFSVIY